MTPAMTPPVTTLTTLTTLTAPMTPAMTTLANGLTAAARRVAQPQVEAQEGA